MKFNLIIDEAAEEEITATVRRPSALTDAIALLVQQHSGTDRICTYREEALEMLSFGDIECITVEDGKTYAVDRKGRHLRLKQRLYELEAILPGCFIRISKSTLANELALVQFRAGFSGAVEAVFRCGYTEYVSRRCFSQIKRRFDGK